MMVKLTGGFLRKKESESAEMPRMDFPEKLPWQAERKENAFQTGGSEYTKGPKAGRLISV